MLVSGAHYYYGAAILFISIKQIQIPTCCVSLYIEDCCKEILRTLVLRTADDLLRRSLLGDITAVDKENAVRDLAGKAHLVRHYDHRHAVGGELLHYAQHLSDHLGIESRCRLVEQHYIRIHAERAGDSHALLLSAGELIGIGIRLFAESDDIEHLARLFASLRLALLFDIHRSEGQVIENAVIVEEIEVLKDHSYLFAHLIDIGTAVADIRAVDDNGARTRCLELVQATEKGGLSAAGGSDYTDDLALVNVGGDIAQHLGPAEMLGKSLNVYLDVCFLNAFCHG